MQNYISKTFTNTKEWDIIGHFETISIFHINNLKRISKTFCSQNMEAFTYSQLLRKMLKRLYDNTHVYTTCSLIQTRNFLELPFHVGFAFAPNGN